MKIVALILLTSSIISPAFAGTPDFEKLVTAVFKAEGETSKHPYGILTKYKSTSPRTACLNTLRHKYRDWLVLRAHGSVVSYGRYLSSKYAPINSDTDNGTNQFWLKNVTYFYGETI